MLSSTNDAQRPHLTATGYWFGLGHDETNMFPSGNRQSFWRGPDTSTLIWSDNQVTRQSVGGWSNWASGQPQNYGSWWYQHAYVDMSNKQGSPAAGAWYIGHTYSWSFVLSKMCRERRECQA
jgi:hypothetical protein